MALTKIKLNTMVTGTLPDANIPDDITIDATTLSTNFTVTANNSTDETVYPIFVDGATGTQGAETDTGLTYNPSSGLLTATGFSGNITGNVTGNTSGTAATVTGAAQSAITSVGTLTGLTVQGSNYTTLSIQSGTTSHGAILNLGSSDDIDYGSITQFASGAGEGGRMRFKAGTTEVLNLYSNGNATFAGDIGVGGNTLNSWNSLHSAIQLGYGAVAVRQNNNTTYLTNNIYYEDSGSANPTYMHENEASALMCSDGNMLFFNAPSGTGTATLTERLRVDTEGNVGIGSGTNTNSHIVRGFSANKGLVIETQQPAIQLVDSDNNGRYFTMAYEQSAKTVYMHNQSNGPFRFDTNGVERMNLTGDGNLVIKTPTAAGSNSQSLPGYLSFQGFGWDSDSGSDAIEGRITFAGSYSGTHAASGGGTIPEINFGIMNSGDAGATSESLVTVLSIKGAPADLTGGRVSIAGGQTDYSSLGVHTGGTNSYGATSGHHQNSAITIDFPNADQSFGCLRWRSHGNMEHFFGVVQQGANGQGDFVWQGFNGSSYKEWMRLNQAGELRLGFGGDGYFRHYQINSNAHDYVVYCYSDDSYRWNRNGSGSDEMRLESDGDLVILGNLTQSSDIRLKKNIKTIEGALSKVNQLRGVTYNWNKASGKDTEIKHLGMIADEVEEIIPELVKTDSVKGSFDEKGLDNIKSLKYGNVVGLLVEAVKELSAKVTALENA